MPCYTVTTARIKLGANTDMSVLKTALEKVTGHAVVEQHGKLFFKQGQYLPQTGELEVTGLSATQRETFTAQVKQTYSEVVVLSQAEMYGWNVETVDQNQGA